MVQKVPFINENSPKMGKWAKKAVKRDIWQLAVDEVKNHLEPLFGTRLEIRSKKKSNLATRPVALRLNKGHLNC